MKIEVSSAANFLMNILRVRQVNSLSESQLVTFKGSLQETLLQRYRCHWYPEVPTKGSGYRCIRINGKMDPIIEQAAISCGMNSRQLRKLLPAELTMWIDPSEVSYRIGENGSICILYDRSNSPSSDLDDSTGSEEYPRFEMTPDLNKLVMDFFEKSTMTIVTKPKMHHNRNRNNFNNHYNNGYNNNNQNNNNIHHNHHVQHHQQQHHNSNNHQNHYNSSPPLSPHHQTPFNNHQVRYQNHYSSSPNKFNNDHHYYHNWDYHHHQTKVRTQC